MHRGAGIELHRRGNPRALALCNAIARAETANRPRRPGSWLLVRADYKPWKAQRLIHRSRARFRVAVCGRGVGKTHSAGYETLQVVLSAPPGSEGAVVAPTFTHAEAAIAKLRELADGVIPNVEWKVQKKRLMLPGKRSIRVYSADRKESVRGPSLVILWIDEGAFLHVKAVEAALPALRSPGVEAKLLVTTTPCGKGWVWDWWVEAEEGEGMERFRFSALDSPYTDPFVIDKARKLMSKEKFAQEMLACFVDNLLLVFPDRAGLFKLEHPERKDVRNWIGIDLGKDQDWTVPTLMNEHGEARVLGRWQVHSPGMVASKFWGQTDKRLIGLCEEHNAMAVVDTGGPGGAAGAVLAENLRAAGIPVMEVKTNVQGTKAEIVEQAIADVDWRKVSVLGDPDTDPHCRQLDYEMSRFQGIKRVVRGQSITIYEGPQLPGEHDDMVISFCLANWGRSRAEPDEDPLAGDLSGFVRDAEAIQQITEGGGWGAVPGTGYTF